MWGTVPRSTSAPAAKERLFFANDYQEGAHPLLLEALTSHNLTPAPGYGLDPWCESARAKRRAACGAPEAAVATALRERVVEMVGVMGVSPFDKAFLSAARRFFSWVPAPPP